jgi:membrane protein YdbS with pleckstrin-like domain
MDVTTDAAARAGANPPDAQAPLDERLDRRVVVYWYVADVLRALVLGAMLLALSHYTGEMRRELPALITPALQGLAGLILLLALVTPPLAYARWRFSVDDRLMRMRYGILFVEERLVPVPRMQHIDLMRGPIERVFGLATLVVFTAGNEGSSFRVPGLAVGRAQELRDRILQARGDDLL